ncbi:hypothetical protein SAMN05192558_101818 [Actinokineospora alba]|uniref:DUF4878 domain-containing protein n=1 Tax=Actinokineospora alba TaxID=504798 RepID=A0A1H0GIQ0_9PSEU|nr:hypothetical protein [Actinokineospora alba]TDP69916.1 hypothetical protein C8E96_5512 [Actinokineospora alba]SDI05964.1 hypothetical protein SAMN05421871_10353 [Actinokineospora alba]SDO06855.1 hypothetical protein SAMN05192558_101818 [Actinokineospora alba]
MTYPPQQPGPYGPQGPYGQQPDPFAGQTAYQGLGGYPGGGEPPAPKNTGKIVAIVAIAVLVLGGGGAAAYFLTKGDDKPSTAAPASSESSKPEPSESDKPKPTKSTKPGTDTGNAASPEDIVTAYIAAYEKKDFSTVTAEACEPYKKKYGTDTSSLEDKLSKYEVKGTAKGDPEVKGSVATAEIDLVLTPETGEPKPAHIRIKIVKEDGVWRFCGEETA